MKWTNASFIISAGYRILWVSDTNWREVMLSNLKPKYGAIYKWYPCYCKGCTVSGIQFRRVCATSVLLRIYWCHVQY